MCEYCGCQEIAVIGELTEEHEAVVAEIAAVRVLVREGRLDAVGAAARRIGEILGPHTAVEEGGLFPLMAVEFPDHIEALEREHRVVEGVLAEAAGAAPADPAWCDRLLAALELLREHILKEQDGLFPASLAVLDSEGWERVESIRAAHPPHLVRCSPHHSPHHPHDHRHQEDLP